MVALLPDFLFAATFLAYCLLVIIILKYLQSPLETVVFSNNHSFQRQAIQLSTNESHKKQWERESGTSKTKSEASNLQLTQWRKTTWKIIVSKLKCTEINISLSTYFEVRCCHTSSNPNPVLTKIPTSNTPVIITRMVHRVPPVNTMHPSHLCRLCFCTVCIRKITKDWKLKYTPWGRNLNSLSFHRKGEVNTLF